MLLPLSGVGVGCGVGVGSAFLTTVTDLLPEIFTAFPSDADVTSPLNETVTVPSPVVTQLAVNVLFVSVASAVASA